jgi:ubiquinone/menaquinone biosynthesis C-methylase UbiE
LPLLGCLLLPALASAQDPVRQREMQETHQTNLDSKAYIAMLNNPERDAHQKPREVIAALKLKHGEVIADVGAGSGYFTFSLAQGVGKSGRVYAVDVDPDMILHLNRRIRESQTKNVVTFLCAPDDPLLSDGSIDRFFICDTWHHIEGHAHYLGLLKKVLKPGGQIVIIDYKKAKTPVGPPMDIRIDRNDLVREMETNGFRLETEHTFLPYQYFLVFRAK